MKSVLKPIFLLLVFAGLLSTTSCVKDNFDAPPAGGQDPDIEVTYTIAQFKALWTGSNYYVNDTSVVIMGTVVADDESGNFYKNLIIQDSTGGIALRLDASSLYTQYPVGRRVFIKCKGLWIGDYNGLIQLGATPDNAGDLAPIPSGLFDTYILKGSWGNTVTPKVVTISQLNGNPDLYQSTLIELDNVEFTPADAGQTYADAVNQLSVNRTVKDCGSGNMLVRTSGFASFAGKKTPTGNGSLVAIFSVFGADAQLLVREPADVVMDSVRCGGGVIGGDGIAGVASYYSGSDVTLPAGKIIEGIVISDKDNLNINNKNLVLQDSTGGIVVRFASAHSFALGQKVRVDVGGQTLTSYNGLIEVDGVPNANATATGTGSITPRVATFAQITANATAWESTLVQVTGVTITGSSTYAGSLIMNDGTASMTMFTLNSATFSGNSVPAGSVTVTGIVSDFNGVQMNIRDDSDVQ
jgi:hypothetical protein